MRAMTDSEKWGVFIEIHTGNPQAGPGDFESTARAFSMLNPLSVNPCVLDAGCGPGRQTEDLCRLSDGPITAVDMHQPFLDEVKRRVPEGRVKTLAADMGDLPFGSDSFDLIWSEGAIYNIGFFQGLEKFRTMLSKNGQVAVTELSWLKPNPSQEALDFWNKDYPQMQSVEQNLADMERAGYNVLGHFTLPESSWWSYYDPIEKRLPQLEEKYADNPDALEVIATERAEQDLYRNYCDCYGYVFYIGQKK